MGDDQLVVGSDVDVGFDGETFFPGRFEGVDRILWVGFIVVSTVGDGPVESRVDLIRANRFDRAGFLFGLRARGSHKRAFG